jgi:cell division protein FtsQ
MSARARTGLPQGHDLVDLPLAAAEDTPFFRPKTRTRPRVSRRGRTGRAALALQIGGATVLLAGALALTYTKVMASDVLRIVRVDVRGNHRLSEGEVRELLGPALGENILTLEIDRLRGRVAASPWVADARLRRSLPNTLEVEIQERTPLALAELDRLFLMDASGALIDIYGPQTAGFDLPIVRGLKGLDGAERADRAGRAGLLLDELGELAAEVSEVEVGPSGDLRVVLRQDGEVLRLGAPPYRERFATFLRLRKELVRRCPRAEYFDLRFRSRIVAMEPPVSQAEAPGEGGNAPARAAVVEVGR